MGKINYVDVVIAIILLIEIIRGAKSGVIIAIFDIIGLIAGWFLSKAKAFAFSLYLNKQFHITDYFYSKALLWIKLPNNTGSLPANPDTISKSVEALHFPLFLQKLFLKGTIPQGFTLQQFLANRIATGIATGIAFLIIFFAVLIIARIIGILIKKAVRVSPLLRWIDSLLGAIFKVSIAFIIIFIIMQLILSTYGYFHFTENAFINQIETSKFYIIGEKILPIVKEKIFLLIGSVGK